LNPALDGGEGSDACLSLITTGERGPCIFWIIDWLGPRAGVVAVEKKKTILLPGIEPRLSSP
jgi:hypothetical protein